MLKASRLLTSPGVQNTNPGLDNYQMFRYYNYGAQPSVDNATGLRVLTLNTGQYLVLNSPAFSTSNDTRFSATLFNANNTIVWAKNYNINATNEFCIVDACLDSSRNNWDIAPNIQKPSTFAYVCGYSNQGNGSAEQGWVFQIRLSDGSMGWTNRVYTTSSSTYYSCRCVGVGMVQTSGYVQVAVRQNYWGYSGNSPWQSSYVVQYYTSNGTVRNTLMYSKTNETTDITAISDSTSVNTRGPYAGTIGNHSGYPYVPDECYIGYYGAFYSTYYYIRRFQYLSTQFNLIPTDVALINSIRDGYCFYLFGFMKSTISIGAHDRHFVLKWKGSTLSSGTLEYFNLYQGESSSSLDDYNDSPLDYTTSLGGGTSGNPEPQTGKSQIIFDQAKQHFYITLSAPSGGKQRSHIFECRTLDGQVTHHYIIECATDDIIAGSVNLDVYGNLIFTGSINVFSSGSKYRPFIVKLPPPKQQIINGIYNVGGSLNITISTGSQGAINGTSSITTSYVYNSGMYYTTSTATTYVGRQLYAEGTFETLDSTTTTYYDDL